MISKESLKIREMFGGIAHRYDLLNRLLSLSIDRRWRRAASKQVRPFLDEPSVALDLCTGTGDLAIELTRHCSRVIGCDFTHPMLVRGTLKVERKRLAGRVSFAEGDALHLPFDSERFAAVTIAFGLRNLEDYGTGLREMARVLRPGGVLAVLEFSEPRVFPLKQIYLFYFRSILPTIGRLISGDSGAYSYLPASVREFPGPADLSDLIEDCGFDTVRYKRLSGGIAYLHTAVRRSTQCSA